MMQVFRMMIGTLPQLTACRGNALRNACTIFGFQPQGGCSQASQTHPGIDRLCVQLKC